VPEGLRVLLDATAIPADRGGVGRYVDALVHSLGDLVLEGQMGLHVACQPVDADRHAHPGVVVHAVPAPVARRAARLAWEQTGLPRLARGAGATVLHSPHYTMPLRSPVPVVVTVHDLTFFTDPKLHSQVKGTFFRAATRRAANASAHIVTPSAATKEELGRLLDVEPGKVTVAPHGVDPADFHRPSDEDVQRVRQRLGVGPGGWVAFLGTLEPRKNVPALIQAFTLATAGREDAPTLVLAGGTGWDEAVAPAISAAQEAGDKVIRPGYLPLSDLPGLLGGAEVVCYPSLGEGFGLPVLEAMACGAAVLTTRRLSLPEVGGDATAYTGASADEIATALRSLLDAPDRRAELSEAAAVRAQAFTWRATALAHVDAYAQAQSYRRS
jgi:glycosyltransferase involved in cell wall biosynthesis